MNENPSNTHYHYGVVQSLPAKPWNEQFYEQFKTDGSVMWKKERILKQFGTVAKYLSVQKNRASKGRPNGCWLLFALLFDITWDNLE